MKFHSPVTSCRRAEVTSDLSVRIAHVDKTAGCRGDVDGCVVRVL